jgi:hypothetical protein
VIGRMGKSCRKERKEEIMNDLKKNKEDEREH